MPVRLLPEKMVLARLKLLSFQPWRSSAEKLIPEKSRFWLLMVGVRRVWVSPEEEVFEKLTAVMVALLRLIAVMLAEEKSAWVRLELEKSTEVRLEEENSVWKRSRFAKLKVVRSFWEKSTKSRR